MKTDLKALVLDGHSRAALETAQALGRAGIAVHAISSDPHSLIFHSRYVVDALAQKCAAADYLCWIQELDRRNHYQVVVPSTEASLLQLMQLSPDDPMRTKAVLSSNADLRIALNKEETHRLARELKIDVPHSKLHSDIEEIGEAAAYPLVLKPIHSKVLVNGELKTLQPVVVTRDQPRRQTLQSWLPYTPVQEQEYVLGKGVGVELLFERGEKVWHFAHERIHEYPLTGGGSSYRRSIVAPSHLLDAADRLLRRLNWHGVAMVEFKLQPSGVYSLIEVNPRLWGSLALAVDAGVNFPMGLMSIASGGMPVPQPDYKIGYYSRALSLDLEWLKANLTADHSNPLLLTRPKLCSLVEYVRPFLGRESWDHFDYGDLGITVEELKRIFLKYSDEFKQKIRRIQLPTKLRRHHRGVLDRLQGAKSPRKLLFVCYGNICRSPVAEHLATVIMPERNIRSAGFHNKSGRNSPENILKVAREFGVDLHSFKSNTISKQQVAQADLILLMDSENYDQMAERFPDALPRATMLGLFAPAQQLNIKDPYNSSDEETREILRQIQSAVDGLATWSKSNGNSAQPVGVKQAGSATSARDNPS
jgi:protein-tyrosine-phosphatase/predicted ATP-grasp superfamily ATP-dependent carboligase